MGMGFENCEVGVGKKMNWEMGLVPPPPSGPSIQRQYFMESAHVQFEFLFTSRDTALNQTSEFCDTKRVNKNLQALSMVILC